MVSIMPLASSWRFIDSDPGKADLRALSLPGADTSNWEEITLPGDINSALVRHGRMPHPHHGDDARRCFWVTAKEWLLRTEFTLGEVSSGGCLDLCFDGLDGHVDIHLNGEPLGTARNAFRPHRFALDPATLRGSRNALLLRFRSIDEVLGATRGDEMDGWGERRGLMRKPQFSFGWDFALPLPSIGVMGGVKLESYVGPRLKDVSVQTHLSGRIDFKFRVNTAARDAGYHLSVRVSGHGADVSKKIDRPGRCFSHGSLQIDGPALWWPRGLGDAALYDYCVELVVGDEVVEQRTGCIGFREVRIEEDPFTEEGGPGISFWFNVNGRRVFCKGANWVPLETWPADVTDEQYQFYLQKAVEAHFNMLRVWGGGIYERDIFYDLCDRLGIMVWQDFMFASTGYPVDLLRGEIIAEAKHQIRRLRNHPCLMLWCGCNEDVFSWGLQRDAAEADVMADTGIYSQHGPEAEVNRLRDDPQIYSMILRGLVSKMGLCVPYVESSPQSHEDAGNCPESGNSHISSWKYTLYEIPDRPEDFRKLFDQTQSFDSEFCIQGPCDVRSLKEFLPEEHRWPPDGLWRFHIQRANLPPHHEQTLRVAGGIFGAIDSLETYVKHGQAMHVEMMRAEFESARRDRPNNGGTMVWMYNDCWPTSNYSIIDYYRRPKPAYYAAKRACAPVLPIILERKNQVEFFVSNDTMQPVTARVVFGQAKLDGTVVRATERTIRVTSMTTDRFHVLPRTSLELHPDEYLFIESSVGSAALPVVTYFMDGWKNVPWPRPKILLELLEQRREGDAWVTSIKIASQSYARFCHLIIPQESGGHWLSDNFFDLPAGRAHVIEVWSERAFAAEKVIIGDWHSDWP